MAEEQQQAAEWQSSALPEQMRTAEEFKPYNTLGELATAYTATSGKVKELESRVEGSIPKLAENATPEQREAYYTALGRPSKPEEYELAGDDKNPTEWKNYWRNEFLKLGVSKEHAKGISQAFEGTIKQMVDSHNAAIATSNAEAEATLKKEWGDKYPTNVALASRLWKHYTDSDLNTVFAGESSAARVAMMRYIFKVAAKTGEDMSPAAAAGRYAAPGSMRDFYKDMPASRQ